MFVNRASWDMQQEIKSRCGWKEIERGSVEACKHQQDKIRKEKKATVSETQDHFIFTPGCKLMTLLVSLLCGGTWFLPISTPGPGWGYGRE